MSFNAAAAYLDIRRQYLDNVIELATGQFPNAGEDARWKAIRAQLRRDWESDDPATALFARPVLEPLFGYPSCGKSIDDLIRDGVLHESMKNFVDPGMLDDPDTGKIGYKLYRHQLESIQKSKEGKNIVVSSGTGSGKTECFLYSMINNLLYEGAENELNASGVRILLVYPMNALVKDQLKRIYKLVCQSENPHLRVGMYTSQTPARSPQNLGTDQPWTIRGCRDEDERTKRLAHLAWSREEIRATPPHILITNYSMMEYMMLRKADNNIFATGQLKAIVLDEAHLYSGSLGNDINMLLRRTLIQFNKKHEDIRFYATSATIGDGRPETLATAAARLFGVSEDSVCAITGDRDSYASTNVSWPGAAPADVAAALALKQRVLDASDPKGFCQLSNEDLELLARIPPESVDETGKRPFLPYKLHTFLDSPNKFYSDMDIDGTSRPLGRLRRLATSEDGRCGLLIFSSNNLRKEIYFGARMARVVDEMAAEDTFLLFGPEAEWKEADGELHGVYFRFHSPLDEPGVFRFNVVATGAEGGRPKGWAIERDANGVFVFALPSGKNQGDGVPETAYGYGEGNETWRASNGDPLVEFAGIDSMTRDADEDYDDAEDNNNVAATSRYSNRNMMVPLGFVAKSLRSTLVARLVFPHLPDPTDLEGEQNKGDLPWNGRQLLFFSDSRGGSAEMAVSLQSIHRERLVNASIFTWLKANGNYPRSLGDIVDGMAESRVFLAQIPLPQWSYERFAKDARHRGRDPLEYVNANIKKPLLLHSLIFQSIAIRRTGERSLEGVGAVKANVRADALHLGYDGQDCWQDVRDKCKGANPNEQTADWKNRVLPTIVNLLREGRHVYLDTFQKRRGAHLENGDWTAKNELSIIENGLGYLAFDLRKGMFCSRDSFKRRLEKNLAGDNPIVPPDRFRDAADRNSFTEGVYRLLKGLSVGVADLQHAPNALLIKGKNTNDENDGDYGGEDAGIAVNAAALEFTAVEEPVFADNKTNKASVGAAPGPESRDVTALLHESAGYKALVRKGGNELFFLDGNRDLQFKADSFGGLRVPEHSAQLKTDDLGEIEEAFRKHEVNIFSCTPTLEVGVDIGGMCAVVQANLPPEKANYLQRAGRAGRRDAKSAFVLTFLGHGLQDTEVLRDSLSFFRRENPFSVADVNAPSAENQVRSHIWQFLIGKFFQSLENEGRPANPLPRNPGGGNPMEAWEIAGCFLGKSQLLETYRDYLEAELGQADEGRWKDAASRELEQVKGALRLIGNAQNAKCGEMRDWLVELQNNNNQDFEKRYMRVLEGTICEKTIQNDWLLDMLDPLHSKLKQVSDKFNQSLEVIVDKLGAIGGEAIAMRMATALRYQFIAKFREQLIQCLVHERVLPPYGFPVDVISITGDGLDMQRSIFSAIRDFTPQSRLTVGHRKYSVDVLAPSRYVAGGEPFGNFFIARCGDCGYVGEVPGGDVAACPVCGSENGLSVRRYVAPEGFRSILPPRDAASTSVGRLYAQVEEDLILNEHAAVPLASSTQPAKAEFRFISADDDNAVEILCRNKGRYGNGYLVETENFFAISCPRGREDDWRGNAEVRKWLDAHPRRLGGHPDIACKAKVAVWICAIAANCGDLGNDENLRSLIGLALRMEAIGKLRLDSRVINVKIDKSQAGAIRFCLYETSGASSVMAEIQGKGKAILEGALERLEKSESYKGRVENLLSYATDRELSAIPEEAFTTAASWAREHKARY